MSYKATKRDTMSMYNCIEVPYCALQNTLSACTADGAIEIAHTEGVYGWNSTIYLLGRDVAIVTGYRPFGTFHLSERVREAEKALGDIRSWDERRVEADRICDMIREDVREELKARYAR